MRERTWYVIEYSDAADDEDAHFGAAIRRYPHCGAQPRNAPAIHRDCLGIWENRHSNVSHRNATPVITQPPVKC